MCKLEKFSESKFIVELAFGAFLLLLALLIGWITVTIISSKVTAESPLDWLKLVGLGGANLFMAYIFILVGLHFYKQHPMLRNIEQRANSAITKLDNHATFYENAQEVLSESKKIMKDANELFKPYALEKSGVIIIGSSHGNQPNRNELVEKVFNDYKNKAQSLEISFIGTAYGAFSLDEANDFSYGFLDALKGHVETCRLNNVNLPFKKIKFICGSSPLYSLSAKYLCLQLCERINSHPPMRMADIHVAYPQEDCIPAILIIEGQNGGVRALISPSIGKEDKMFLAEHYPIGIIIKDIDNPPPEQSGNASYSASNTIQRLASQFDVHMNNQHEIWSYDRETGLTIKNLHKIKYIKELHTSFQNQQLLVNDKFKSGLFTILMQSTSDDTKIYDQDVMIPKDKIHDTSEFFAFCIKEEEKILQT